MIKILIQRQNLTNEQEINQFTQKFSTFFYEFKDDSIALWLYYFLYIARRIVIIACYNFIEDYKLQISLTLAISLIVISN